MKPRYIQFNCKEIDALDLRQANAVLKHKPDIIILEYPNNNKTPNLSFNNYDALKKPQKMVNDRIKEFPKHILKISPWVKSDTIMWKNIASLWKKNHQILVYSVDAPNELTGELLDVWRYTYPCVKKNWVWWVQIYLRERIMANNLQWVLDNYKEKENPTILIFLQDFHWKHVKFLLKNPGKEEIWNYYFNKYSEISKPNISVKIKKINKVFYKYWKMVSDF
ncbi:MAG: hypothetical protein KAJ58_02505 [Candidatus Pacebacteria bacterium]|nr:hypothetical protein [Candidatus Paceibacterota bacterium]